MEFFFDQSSAHGTHAKDALNANKMNVKPGSTIDLPQDHKYYKFRGQPKGMWVVLEEHGLWDGLCALNGGKALFGDCSDCKMTQKAQDALA